MSTATTEILKSYLKDLQALLAEQDLALLDTVIAKLKEAWEADKQIFIFGNGGSAATASHFVCDLQKGVSDITGKPMRAISLTDQVPLITAWANDTDYSNIFAKQLQMLCNEGDVALAISGSGNSPNVLRGIETAKSKGAYCIGFTGFVSGGKLAPLCDLALIVPSNNMQRVEDLHAIWMHCIYTALIYSS
jgi:D-sedoheptulose 7-phosphate isomerase